MIKLIPVRYNLFDFCTVTKLAIIIIKGARSYVWVKIVLPVYTHGVARRLYLAARHTTVCLDR